MHFEILPFLKAHSKCTSPLKPYLNPQEGGISSTAIAPLWSLESINLKMQLFMYIPQFLFKSKLRDGRD